MDCFSVFFFKVYASVNYATSQVNKFIKLELVAIKVPVHLHD